jgi:hypothetical protein
MRLQVRIEGAPCCAKAALASAHVDAQRGGGIAHRELFDLHEDEHLPVFVAQ